MALFGGKTKNLVGVDVGSSAVKLVSLQGGKAVPKVEAVGSEVLPSGAVVDGVVAKPEAVVQVINKLFQAHGVKEDKIATSVSGHAVIVKKITLPVKTAEEVGESIQWEAEQYIPFDIADVYLDYHLLGTSEDGNESNVILVAAKRESIDSQGDLIAMAGRNPVIMDIDAFALHNVYEVNYNPEPSSVVALLNIGASIMNVNIARGKEFLFTRDISMGGNYYTEYIQRDLGVSFEEAEQYKRGDVPEELKLTLSSVVQSVSEILALEVQKTFDYFRTAAEFEEMQNIFICGGASQTEGLREYLQEVFQVPVEFLSPFQGLQANGAGELPANGGADYAVAVGLALRSPGDKQTGGGGSGGGLAGLWGKLTKKG